MSNKTNIRNFGNIYRHLADPELRRKEAGDAELVVKNAIFSGERFQYLTWKNVRFVNCDFAGAYEIKLEAMENCTFDNCKIVGIHDFGVMCNVHFYRCLSGFNANWGGNTGSKKVLFEECRFIGSDSDQNHQGAIGTYGEATFVRCVIKWFAVTGYTKLVLQNCECEDVRTSLNNEEIGAAVLIEKCKLRGSFDMVPASLQSLTIRDTQIDLLDMNNASVRGDILMERVKGGYANVYVKEARSLTVRDSQFYGNGGKFFEAYAGGIRAIEIDSVAFGGDLTSEPVTIAGGTGADLSTVRPRVNDSIIMRKSKMPRLSTHHVNTALYQLQDCEIGSLDLSSSRIDQLEIAGNTIARSVDFSNTQVKEGKVQPLASGQAKLDGSNIRPPR